MSSNRWILCFMPLVFAIPTVWSNADVMFNQANKYYDEVKYEEAFRLYDSIEKMGYHSAELYFNKGNCAYKIGWTPHAILNYEKALRINPGFEDAIHNLIVANEQVADKNMKISQRGLLLWLSSFFSGNYQYIGNIALLILVLFGVFYTVHLWMNPLHRHWLRLAVIFLISGVLTLSLALVIAMTGKQKVGAIIMEPIVTIYNEPSDNSSAAFILHEGSRVEILQELELWYKVAFDAKVGWVHKSGVAEI
jgi:tetratricopeptide (TPR) repeat protein